MTAPCIEILSLAKATSHHSTLLGNSTHQSHFKSDKMPLQRLLQQGSKYTTSLDVINGLGHSLADSSLSASVSASLIGTNKRMMEYGVRSLDLITGFRNSVANSSLPSQSSALLQDYAKRVMDLFNQPRKSALARPRYIKADNFFRCPQNDRSLRCYLCGLIHLSSFSRIWSYWSWWRSVSFTLLRGVWMRANADLAKARSRQHFSPCFMAVSSRLEGFSQH